MAGDDGMPTLEDALTLARRVAARFGRVLPSLADDLGQEAAIAAWDALRRFDPGRGVKFSTFAGPRVIGAIKDAMRAAGLKGYRRQADDAPRVDSVGDLGMETDAGGRRDLDIPSGELPIGWEAESEDEVRGLIRGLPAGWGEMIGRFYLHADAATLARCGAMYGLSERRMSEIRTRGESMLRERWSGTDPDEPRPGPRGIAATALSQGEGEAMGGGNGSSVERWADGAEATAGGEGKPRDCFHCGHDLTGGRCLRCDPPAASDGTGPVNRIAAADAPRRRGKYRGQSCGKGHPLHAMNGRCYTCEAERKGGGPGRADRPVVVAPVAPVGGPTPPPMPAPPPVAAVAPPPDPGPAGSAADRDAALWAILAAVTPLGPAEGRDVLRRACEVLGLD